MPDPGLRFGVVLIRDAKIALRWVAVALLVLLLAAACGRAPSPAEGPPRRVVSLLPTATEILFALGAGDRVVGRSRYCDWPPEARAIPVAGDAVSVSPEVVLSLRPDLVLAGSAAQVEALAAVSRQVPVVPVAAESIADLRRVIREIAGRLGLGGRGEALVASLDGALGAARRRSRGRRPVSVLFVAQRTPLVVAGGPSYVSELLAALGARNAAGDLERAWPSLSLEALVTRDPEVILDADLVSEAGGAEAFWARFTTLRAVREHRVRRLRAPGLLRPGPRLPAALAELQALVHGEGR